MKKLLAITLALVLCVGLFAGCAGDPTPTPARRPKPPAMWRLPRPPRLPPRKRLPS